MRTLRFVYWQDEDFWMGYLQDYPDYMTQGDIGIWKRVSRNPVPRHREIKEYLAKHILKKLCG